MSLPLNQVVVGDCTEVMQGWPADSIDLVVTSPPYWGLRDYGSETVRVWGGDSECEHEWGNSIIQRQRGTISGLTARVGNQIIGVQGTHVDQGNFCAKCGAWRGSLGLEPHPQLFIDHLVEICREIKRVLKPTGTFFLNLGDTYYGSGGKGGQYAKWMRNKGEPKFFKQGSKKRSNWLQPKQKLMMPARVAIALQDDGWILRNSICWWKPNHMPSSVKDRLTNAYEPVFLFAKQGRYYFDLDAIRQPQKSIMEKHEGASLYREGHPSAWSANQRELNPMGKNPGDLWRIPTRPFPGAHFATFPPGLIEPIIKAGSPRWVCSKCGEPRTRITGRPCTNCGAFILTQGKECPSCGFRNTEWLDERKVNLVKRAGESTTVGPLVARRTDLTPHTISAGWSDCGCGEKWIPGVVMDPFGGSGTVGRVAHRPGRSFIIIEIKPEYTEMAHQRIRGKYKPLPEGVVTLDQFMEAKE